MSKKFRIPVKSLLVIEAEHIHINQKCCHTATLNKIPLVTLVTSEFNDTQSNTELTLLDSFNNITNLL